MSVDAFGISEEQPEEDRPLYDDEDDEPESGTPEGKAPRADWVYATLEDWVEDWLVGVLGSRRYSSSPGKGRRWDPMWWTSTEAVSRLQALWTAWEKAKASDDLAAMSSWWIHHFDPHMRVLLDGEDGPFHSYDPDGVRKKAMAVPYVRPPAGWFDK